MSLKCNYEKLPKIARTLRESRKITKIAKNCENCGAQSPPPPHGYGTDAPGRRASRRSRRYGGWARARKDAGSNPTNASRPATTRPGWPGGGGGGGATKAEWSGGFGAIIRSEAGHVTRIIVPPPPGGGGGGLGPKSLCTQKWPDQIFPIESFMFSHDGPFALGGTPHLLLRRFAAILTLPCPPPLCAAAQGDTVDRPRSRTPPAM